MNYIFQRLVKNDFQWLRPSPGRLGKKRGEGTFVQENGFGYEDWNFNEELIIDNNIYGYLPYTPTEEKRKEKYNIIFGIYNNSKWYLVGIYKDAEYVEKSPTSAYIFERKANDLTLLGSSLGKKLKSKKDIITELKRGAKYIHWKVKPENIIRTEIPVEIPNKILNIKNYRINNPTILSQKQYNSVHTLLTNQYETTITPDIIVEFPEGRLVETQHRIRERNPTIIKMAKENYKKQNKNLECQVCGFSFTVYGEVGKDYIEAHHTIPVSQMTGKSKTKIEDIALVCSNCHKMLHRKRPWLKMSEIKSLLLALKHSV